jgi:hypothetical protein
MAYTIEKNIPMPEIKQVNKWEKHFPFLPYMQVNDSFFIPASDPLYRSIPYSAATKLKMTLKRIKVVDPVKGTGYRIWRIK